MMRSLARVLAVGAVTLTTLLVSVPPAQARDWVVVGGGDRFRSGYNPDESAPYFVRSGLPAIQPNPLWVTKLSDLPSGVFIMGGVAVAEGLVFVTGGSTNSIVALDQDTGLPVWRFQPDPRGSKNMPGDGYSGGYTGTNAPWYNDGVLYATFTNGTLYALDAGTGNKLWRFEVPDAGAPGEVTDGVVPANRKWVYDTHHETGHCDSIEGPICPPLRAEVAPFTGDYAKFHSAVSYCDGKVFVETLDARVFAVRATDGSMVWHRYVGAPDYPGEFRFPDQPDGGLVPAIGRPTRRFEAQAGPGCLDNYLFVPVEDGFVKLFDQRNGRFITAYDSFHAGDLGFVNDMGAGLAVPANTTANQTNQPDIIVNSLNNRMIRLNVPDMTPQWTHLDAEAGQLSVCEDRNDRSTCSVIPTSQGEQLRQDGPIGGAVFGGNLSIDYDRGIIANGNQDGHLYLWRNADATGANPTLIPNPDGSGIGSFSTAKNPGAKPPDFQNPDFRDSISFYTPDDGKNGPWVHRTNVLSSSVMGGGVVYFNASWEHAIYGVQYLGTDGSVLPSPRLVFKYTLQFDKDFRYPPFGATYPQGIVDLDNLMMGSPALSDGRLYMASFDGSVTAFDLQSPVGDTQKNLAILGSGLVPLLPEYTQPRGTFDRVWTPAEWYKNQNSINENEDYRLPSPGSVLPIGLPIAVLALWARRRIRQGPRPPRSRVDLRPPDLDLRGSRWR